MRKFFSRIWNNILFLETLFLLIFIPLLPKIPLLDVRNTWVYIRAEDFIVFFVLLSWIILLTQKKIKLKTPITIPIFIFWIIGAVATLHGILVIFPTIANVFSNVAFFSLLRHIEYMSMFFIAYQGVKDKKQLIYIIGALFFTLLTVSLYGFGQKYLGFPAYLTGNEEFAKGVPIILSQASRVPSTFAGHYDLAAYLVLLIPIMVSLFFGVRNILVKISFLFISLLGFVLLLMTVSRISFFVLFVSLFIVIFFQKRKLIMLSIPIIAVLAIFLLTYQSSLFDRFKNTVSEVNVLVDAKTGESVGHVKFVEKEYFREKTVLQRRVKDREELTKVVGGEDDKSVYATSSAIVRYEFIPQEVALVQAVNISTGENLPQGTGYTNLYLSPVIKRVGNFYYELPPDYKASPSAQVLVLHGDFIVKRASAYDLSFTTRFQGEWPNALLAFKRNIILGSGYGSVSLAVDNNYLRILGEIGILGFVSFFAIFLILGIFIKKTYSNIDSPFVKSFILGFSAGVTGLFLNALLIDVFEASKIAFVLWILMGVIFAVLSLYQKKEINLLAELKKAALSTYAVFAYLLIFAWFLYSNMINGYFTGDDFTWLRWAADCKDSCSPVSALINYFTNSDGFFYRPGTKLYFYIMYQIFWLNQAVFHFVSLILHFLVAALFFVLSQKILKNFILSFAGAFMFLILSGGLEGVFWIAATGHLVNSVFVLLSLIMFILWEEKRKLYYYILSITSIVLGLLFQELGIVTPLLIIAYKVYKEDSLSILKTIFKKLEYITLFIPILGYLAVRFLSQSHWFSGDYNYNLIKLPFNFAGNILGYLMLTVFGPISFSFYNVLRTNLRENILISFFIAPFIIAVLYFLYYLIKKNLERKDLKIVLFGISFFVISLIPFIGLGNITSRYSYLASIGVILIFAVLAKKLYEALLVNGKNIALSVVSVVLMVFVLFHIIQAQQTYSQWQDAGDRTKKFFISLEAIYSDYWSGKDVEFHFVDVPIKFGGAWIFPVGLQDAVWFAFKNDNAKVFQHGNLKEAMLEAGPELSHPVFKFNSDGSVAEVDRFSKKSPNLINPSR
ncbi:MAG: hypothetical protein COU25_03985 [Candidatus Levybacteria bacterium CG10_big_fil_rev_8_21_14_0_10_35_13]|nr:MAG: hypothetical protein COU25_03985 [Candidatus Levybacteria bacterium CG10_big_fil_rev_8_21_14_0_10_35_13]